MGKLLGDLVADTIKAFGFGDEKKPCTPCEKRRQRLNAWHERQRQKRKGGK